ncbi:MAG: hypothetical protein SF123_11565 [Chloroflexota bacterium]|nr:hypothetical protein [Chloroflexota bacterium]
MTDQIDYQAVREEVEVQLDKRKRQTRLTLFIVNLFLYILFMILGWGMASTTGMAESAVGGMAMLSTVGFLGVLFQFILVMLDTKNGEDQLRRQLMGEAIGAHILRMGSTAEKAKAKREMTLTDDGELEPVSMDELLDEQEAARRGGQR